MNNNLTIDKYISGFDPKTQAILQQIRQLITQNAPGASEKISYGLVGYSLNGPLVYFGGFKNHIGLYPTSSGTAAFSKELSLYKHGKGSIQFPLKESIPFDLIKKIVAFRVKENLSTAPL